jgi:hypothetical protein
MHMIDLLLVSFNERDSPSVWDDCFVTGTEFLDVLRMLRLPSVSNGFLHESIDDMR